MCNSINEKTGGNINSEEMYLMVLFDINGGSLLFENIDVEKLHLDMENLLFKNNNIKF